MSRFSVALGGLGGGGDVGGAMSIAIPFRRLGIEPVFISFGNCRVDDISGASRVSGAILKITADSWSSGRFFEPHVASLGYETYLVCTRERKCEVVGGLKCLVRELGVEMFIVVDLGGDSLVFGDEPLLGSFKTDMLSLAALTEVAGETGLRVILAVGALGLEGGGGELSLPHLADNLLRLYRTGAYIGCYIPPKEVFGEVIAAMNYLLSRERSAMLTLYRDALLGKIGRRRYDVAYLHGEVTIKPYHGYLFLFKAKRVCEHSILCREALKGWASSLEHFERQRRKIREIRSIPTLDKATNMLAKRRVQVNQLIEIIDDYSN